MQSYYVIYARFFGLFNHHRNLLYIGSMAAAMYSQNREFRSRNVTFTCHNYKADQATEWERHLMTEKLRGKD